MPKPCHAASSGPKLVDQAFLIRPSTMLLTQKPLVRGLLPVGQALPARTPPRRQSRSGSLHVCNVLAAPPRPAASPLPQFRPQPSGKVRWPRTTVQMRSCGRPASAWKQYYFPFALSSRVLRRTRKVRLSMHSSGGAVFSVSRSARLQLICVCRTSPRGVYMILLDDVGVRLTKASHERRLNAGLLRTGGSLSRPAVHSG